MLYDSKTMLSYYPESKAEVLDPVHILSLVPLSSLAVKVCLDERETELFVGVQQHNNLNEIDKVYIVSFANS